MEPTSEQTRHAVFAAVPVLTDDDLLSMQESYRSPEANAAAASGPGGADPASAFGCVDWYLYPDAKPESIAA